VGRGHYGRRDSSCIVGSRIVGATGAQGEGVVAAFINNPANRVRAITGNYSFPIFTLYLIPKAGKYV
jgi:hypothetical protein